MSQFWLSSIQLVQTQGKKKRGGGTEMCRLHNRQCRLFLPYRYMYQLPKHNKSIRRLKKKFCGTILLKNKSSPQHAAGPSVDFQWHYWRKRVTQYRTTCRFFRMLVCTDFCNASCCSPREMIMQKAPPVKKARKWWLCFSFLFSCGSKWSVQHVPAVGVARRASVAKRFDSAGASSKWNRLDDTYNSKHSGIEELGQQARSKSK